MNTVVITGATSGIGNFLVKEFSDAGWRVFAGYRNESLKEALSKISSNVVPFYVDMSLKESVKAAGLEISSQCDKIEILINAAGFVVAGAMECLPLDRIREQFEVNTFSHLELTQGLFDKLQGGRVINISSMASFGIFPFIGPYCASKRALDILFNSMQLECGLDLEIVSVKPGVIKTPLWDKSITVNALELDGNQKYEKEFAFLAQNAKKNNKKGLDAHCVAKKIFKIAISKNVKPSYTIGLDAKFAELFSHFPQGVINSVVKSQFKKRVGSLV